MKNNINVYDIFIIYYFIINIITFCMFAIDKYRAVHNKWRIRERILLGLSFAGGAAGGILAMYMFHHKTRKAYFFVGVPVMLLIHAVLIGVLILK